LGVFAYPRKNPQYGPVKTFVSPGQSRSEEFATLKREAVLDGIWYLERTERDERTERETRGQRGTGQIRRKVKKTRMELGSRAQKVLVRTQVEGVG
jgi:hypothetical protein